MAFQKIEIHKINLTKRKQQLKQDYPEDSKIIIEHLRQKLLEDNITEKRQEKIISAIRSFLKHMNKPLSQITRKDLEDYKLKNKKLSDKTMKDYCEIISSLFENKFPDKFRDWDLKKWFKIKVSETTPEVLTEPEVQKLYDGCKNEKERFIVSVLFDSGFRASEFLNLRFEDVIQPTSNNPYFKFDMKGEYSKTLGRIVSCFWKNSTKAIREYLETQSSLNPKAQIIKDDYDNIRRWVSRLGKRTIKKNVNLHMFRKSSATHYASKLNRQQLCKRYGWKFSSRVVDVYISRAGLDEEEVTEKIRNGSMEKLEKENQELLTTQQIQKETLEKLQEKFNKFQEAIAKTKKSKSKDILEVFEI